MFYSNVNCREIILCNKSWNPNLAYRNNPENTDIYLAYLYGRARFEHDIWFMDVCAVFLVSEFYNNGRYADGLWKMQY